MEPLEVIEHRGLRIEIHADEDAPNPRTDMDNFGVMACMHGRYSLGDGGLDLLADVVRKSRFYRPSWDDEYSRHYIDLSTGTGLDEALEKCRDIIALPLYLMDHSGLSMQVDDFNDPWDSGRVGVIFASYDMIHEEYSAGNVTKAIREKVLAVLRSEVETYDAYLRGDAYGYIVKKLNDDGEEGEEVDSCWGFYGQEDCIAQAKQSADYFVDKA